MESHPTLTIGDVPLRYVDSHTAGEPTRVVVSGGPRFSGHTVAEQARDFQEHQDAFRQALILEPRGSEILVGAWLVPSATADLGVIFFNNVGLLGMCGHGMIGVARTLVHLGLWQGTTMQLETPVGLVPVTRHDDGSFSLQNVLSYRAQADLALEVPGYGQVRGDLAWGGNWFFLVAVPAGMIERSRLGDLLRFSQAIKAAVTRIHPEVDHIELTSAAADPAHQGRNFVLCPGNAFDRSPCGTGTSAKLACLAAAGTWPAGAIWKQESILGTVFEGSYEFAPGGIRPTIRGRAYLTAESTLIQDPDDPFRTGFCVPAVN